MIQFKKGNILKAETEALVNTVNTVGVMGKGIALAFKKAFPDNFKSYKKACDKEKLKIGELLITQTGRITPKYIINFPTKVHWKEKSKLEYIEQGMKKLVQVIEEEEIQSIALPPLGCGNGGLDWQEVKKVMLNELSRLPENIELIIFEPGFNNQSMATKQVKKLTPARAMLLTALKNYQVLGYSINLLVAQKLAYFMQRLGEPLNLEYDKGYYGPYSHRLQHLLKYLNGWYLNFKNEQTKPGTIVDLNYTAQVEKYTYNELSADQKNRLENLQQLTEGFESPYGLELLATVDFIYLNTGLSDKTQILQEIEKWTNRKKELMKPFHIETAFARLSAFYELNKFNK
ncbi:MAG: macro domain-containing protein [Bacteroidota bacterium]|nr:macro domain-containing protein [Bacteroidota bacterium]